MLTMSATSMAIPNTTAEIMMTFKLSLVSDLVRLQQETIDVTAHTQVAHSDLPTARIVLPRAIFPNLSTTIMTV